MWDITRKSIEGRDKQKGKEGLRAIRSKSYYEYKKNMGNETRDHKEEVKYKEECLEMSDLE